MIREADIHDLTQINEIYNQAVASRFETADLKSWTEDQRLSWYRSCNRSQYPLLVEEENGFIRGWLSLNPYRNGREALRFTTEISYYVHSSHRRKGVGRALVNEALEIARDRDFRVIFAIILDKNTASLSLLKSCGFLEWGYLPDVADFDGETCGHSYLGIKLI
jgi:phosphinothricin acetyltransferase